MEFNIHPSDSLQKLFREKPYQGQSPEKASIIFLSSDANYSTEISNHTFFEYITEYQEDGVKFWGKYGCHHPFLLDNFPFNKNSGGRPFHKTFSRIGLTKEYAKHISFVELLDIATVGNKSENKELFYSLMNTKHLKFLDNLITNTSNKLIFISSGVLKDMNIIKTQFDVFSWLDPKAIQEPSYSKKFNSNQIQKIYHFSSSKVNNQLKEIKLNIDQWLSIDQHEQDELGVHTNNRQRVLKHHHETVSGKTCSICNSWFENSEFTYGNRENNSYCKSCNRQDQAARKLGGSEAAKKFREEKKLTWLHNKG